MTDIFVSVDVETTGPCPGAGELATIGAVAVNGDTLVTGPEFYLRLQPAGTHLGVDFSLDAWSWDQDTRAWWMQQDPDLQGHTFFADHPGIPTKLTGGARVTPNVAARQFQAWLRDLPGRPVFVAHPAGFDWAWINSLFAGIVAPGESLAEVNPFGYRPACLRSLAWALGDGTSWDVDRASSRYHHPSKIPHHALHDARAQALTLIDVLREIRRQS